MTMITPSYLGETIEYSSLHACRSTLEDPTPQRRLRPQRAEPAKNGSNREINGPDDCAGQHRDGPVHAVDGKQCWNVQEKSEHSDVARSDPQQEVAALGRWRRRRVQFDQFTALAKPFR